MGNRTKNDLSYSSTKLDYLAILKTSEIAFAKVKEDIRRELRELDRYPLTGCFYLRAQSLARDAEFLVEVSETLYTLRGGLEREEFEVVNKP